MPVWSSKVAIIDGEHGHDRHRGRMTSTAPIGARDHCLAPERIDAPADGAGRYGRMFELPALEVDEELLHRIGATGGFCDGGECKDEADVEAGWPFFGQYIAHDLTADRSPLRAHADVDALRNMRSPRANLEALYGGGPAGSPYMYQRDDPAKLLENDGDLPRNQEGLALIGDPRNDVHIFTSQMQVAFIAAHNRLVDRLREDGVGEQSLFDEARRALSWHYQWVIVNEFLPGLTGGELVAELLRSGRRYYRPRNGPFIPLEFADAAYRYGHSQVRQLYRIQETGPRRPVFPDLIGFGPIGDRRVDWMLLFDFPGRPRAQRAKPIDGQLPRSLIELPQVITGAVEEEAYRSLAARDLERGQGTGLPSGESVVRLIGAEVLTPEQVGIAEFGWRGETPLWLYILREAAVRRGGDRLGEVGSRIVAEVLVGIISADPESYLSLDPGWLPTLPRRGERFGLRDLLVPA
jgi:Animal haem peroxidase